MVCTTEENGEHVIDVCGELHVEMGSQDVRVEDLQGEEAQGEFGDAVERHLEVLASLRLIRAAAKAVRLGQADQFDGAGELADADAAAG